MKTICLLRHSKSDWDTPFSIDHERGLSERGLKNANSLNKLFVKRNLHFDLVYISDSIRTMETFRLVSKNNEFYSSTKVDSLLYEADPNYYFNLLETTNNKNESLLFIGHNPGMEIFANNLLGNQFETESLFTKFPTSALCILNFNTNKWIDIPAVSRGTISFFWTPEKGKDI